MPFYSERPGSPYGLESPDPSAPPLCCLDRGLAELRGGGIERRFQSVSGRRCLQALEQILELGAVGPEGWTQLPDDLGCCAHDDHLMKYAKAGPTSFSVANFQWPLRRERDHLTTALPFLLLEILEDPFQVIVETSSMLLANLSDFFDDRVLPHEIQQVVHSGNGGDRNV
jgi:hypothetical protein